MNFDSINKIFDAVLDDAPLEKVYELCLPLQEEAPLALIDPDEPVLSMVVAHLTVNIAALSEVAKRAGRSKEDRLSKKAIAQRKRAMDAYLDRAYKKLNEPAADDWMSSQNGC